MTLEEVKTEICDAFDRAWSTLAGTRDVDRARDVAAATTAVVNAHVLAGEALLFNHVADNAALPPEENVGATVAVGETGTVTVSNPAAPGEPVAAPIVQAAAPVTQPDGPAHSAPEGSVQLPAEPVTGMAPAAGEPVAENTEEA